MPRVVAWSGVLAEIIWLRWRRMPGIRLCNSVELDEFGAVGADPYLGWSLSWLVTVLVGAALMVQRWHLDWRLRGDRSKLWCLAFPKRMSLAGLYRVKARSLGLARRVVCRRSQSTMGSGLPSIRLSVPSIPVGRLRSIPPKQEVGSRLHALA